MVLPIQFRNAKVNYFLRSFFNDSLGVRNFNTLFDKKQTPSKLLKFTREENYSNWYYDVIASADLAENSVVRGCMAIKPYGYAIWENIQKQLDDKFKADGIENAYFPLFIPLSFFQREASHVAGFAKECAVVTHYRLKTEKTKIVQSIEGKLEVAKSHVLELEQSLIKAQHEQVELVQSIEGKLEVAKSHVLELEQSLIKAQHEHPSKIIPDDSALLAEPLVVRPTSETIIGHHFSQWIRSYRDLPLRINQWANVVRWEHQTKIFLRTSEILWQEGHTAHETHEQAQKEALKIAKLYSTFMEDHLAMPVITGEKSPIERFAGAENSYTFEAMMQDGKALQAGTSHFLGQKFSKPFDIGFFNRSNERDFVYTTSWGVTTRLIGSVIMMHSDDDGLRLPPMIAPKQIVMIPAGIKSDEIPKELVLYMEQISEIFKKTFYKGYPLRFFVDSSQKAAGKKFWDSVVKGVPIRLEVGLKDSKSKTVVVSRRDMPHKSKTSIPFENISDLVLKILDDIQRNYFMQALDFQQRNIITGVDSFEELKKIFESMKNRSVFVLAKWCEEPESEKLLEQINNVSIRCIPFNQSGSQGVCVLTGKPATKDIIIGQSY